MDFRYQKTTEWQTGVPLTNAETRQIEICTPGTGYTILRADDQKFLTWGIMTQLNATLNVYGDILPTVAPGDVIYTQLLLGGTFMTPYLLGAPMSNSGYVVITRPFIRIELIDLGLADHTYTRLYVKAW